MTTSVSAALAVELQPHSPTRWIATYYPMVTTPAGRWADVTWALHQRLLPTTPAPVKPTRWLEAHSSEPGHPGYAGHRAWSAALAAGYTTALTIHDAGTAEEPLSPHETQQLRAGTVVVPAGQLSEWVLDDLQDQTTRAHG